MLILAGDIGGTSTRLAYFDAAMQAGALAVGRFPSRGGGEPGGARRPFRRGHELRRSGLLRHRRPVGRAGCGPQSLPWSVTLPNWPGSWLPAGELTTTWSQRLRH